MRVAFSGDAVGSLDPSYFHPRQIGTLGEQHMPICPHLEVKLCHNTLPGLVRCGYISAANWVPPLRRLVIHATVDAYGNPRTIIACTKPDSFAVNGYEVVRGGVR